MPTPLERLLDSDYQSQKILRDHLVGIYKLQHKNFIRELRRRLKKTVLLPDGTWSGPAMARTRILINSLRKLEKELQAIAPTIAAQVRPLDALVNKNTLQWFDHLAAKAAKGVAEGVIEAKRATSAIQLAKTFRASLAEGSYVETKILEGAYKSLADRGQQSIKRTLQSLTRGNDIEAKVYQRLVGKKGAHDLLLQRMRTFLNEGMQSGRNFNELAMILEKEIWGVDWKATGTDKGVISTAKRLIRTEYQRAHNLRRYDVGVKDPNAVGYVMALDPEHCEWCGETYGQKRFMYGKNEPPLAPLHPNCHCSIVDYIFKKPL